MKYTCFDIIVVEGKEDVSFLSSFINATYVTTNGFDVSEDTVLFLKKAQEKRKIIILTDPDESGQRIRKVLNDQIYDCINIEINISSCTRGIKNGVAESTKEEIIRCLNKYLVLQDNAEHRFSNADLYFACENEEDMKKLRLFLSSKLSLGKCNNKTFIKRLNSLNISKETLKELIELYSYGNK